MPARGQRLTLALPEELWGNPEARLKQNRCARRSPRSTPRRPTAQGSCGRSPAVWNSRSFHVKLMSRCPLISMGGRLIFRLSLTNTNRGAAVGIKGPALWKREGFGQTAVPCSHPGPWLPALSSPSRWGHRKAPL